MKFYINSIHLWFDKDKHRELKFLNNKVNVITGEQSKGKSTIIEIIDYCFFSSSCPISDDNNYLSRVQWFGINFTINDKTITIIRHYQNLKDYYFSSAGEIPPKPFVNIKEDNIKNTIKAEFSITDNIVFPFGGKEIKKGSQISPRYFMLFNTQRRNTLSSDEVLFDKQTRANLKEQEALTRIFDIAIGATTVENLIKKEILESKQKELLKLELKEEKLKNKTKLFYEEIEEIALKAKKLNLVEMSEDNNKVIDTLSSYIVNNQTINNQIELQALEEEKLQKSILITKYKKYIKQYKEYKSLLKKDVDSLKPIEYIQKHFSDILQVENLNYLVDILANELKEIKSFVSSRTLPSVKNLEQEIEGLQTDINEITQKIDEIKNDDLSNLQNEQLLFLGEVKAKLSLYNQSEIEENYTKKIEKLQEEIKQLEDDIEDINRTDILDTLSEYMQEVFVKVDFNLTGYEGYKPIFDYKTKLINLKKVDKKVTAKNVIKNIGSSSNHLFLHLAFFSAIHRLFVKQNVPFIPQFLILDQPDSPYYDTSNKDSLERQTFFKALKILDNHIEFFTQELKEDFQIIVLEHVEWKEIEEQDFKHYHLVEEWRTKDSGLVPNNF